MGSDEADGDSTATERRADEDGAPAGNGTDGAATVLAPGGNDRARELHDLLATADAVTIVCHDNPDPDCLASAMALGRLAENAGVEDVIATYDGQISHQQNRAFVNLLEVNLDGFDPALLEDRFVAFVDHSVPGQNNPVPPETPVDVVIDHHPAEEVEARFVDRRESAGATATILTEYVRALDVDLEGRLATALLFAIRRETLDFLRGVTAAEHDAAAVLHPHADEATLRRLASPPVTGSTADALSTAIDNREIHGSALLSHVGHTGERDAIPQAVDYLVDLEGVATAVVFGIVDDAIEVSARSTDSRVHAGEMLEHAFSDVGSAGGHREMAGGQIPLGIFADAAGAAGLVDFVEGIVNHRLADTMNLPEDDEE